MLYSRAGVVESDLAERDDLVVLQHGAHALLDAVVPLTRALRVHADSAVHLGFVHQRQELLL